MLPWLLDAAYLLFLMAVSPWLFYRRFVQKKPIAGLRQKLTGQLPRRQPQSPCLWLHAVSVGEVVQLRQVIDRLRSRYPSFEFVITTTTGTGYDVAKAKYADCTVHYFPLDFSWAVRRAMKLLKPQLIVLVELELWPNFLLEARRRDIPVAVINGRISDKSLRSYRRVKWVTRPMLELCSVIAVQNAAYAERFLELGAAPSRLFVTGNIKFDGLETNCHNPQTAELRRAFDLCPDELVLLAGSTQDPEERYALDTWEKLRAEFPQLRLLIVPRHKERFEEVAKLIESRGHTLRRRSRESRVQSPEPAVRVVASAEPQPLTLNSQPVLLLDTLGELSKAWGLADIAFVGGSLTNRGGQNMMEPAAYGAAVLFGPNTWNFRDVTEALLSREAAKVIHGADELTAVVRQLLVNVSTRSRLGTTAREFVLTQQGATTRTIELLGRVMPAAINAPMNAIPTGRAA